MKFFTKTFGCQMNAADSDEMGRHFRERGFQATDDPASADLILVNTCTVRDLAEHKAMSFIGRLKEWKESRGNGMVVVTGCAAERAKKDILRRFPHVDLVVGAIDIENFPKELDGAIKKQEGKPKVSAPAALTPALSQMGEGDDIPQPALSPIIKYVTIMRGCNYNCSYCIVPSVRGREVYIPVEEILKSVAERVAEGAKEIWLLGQTVNSYKPAVQPTPGYDFADLLRDVAAVPGAGRIRFISPHPYYLSEKLVRAMAETKNVCEHIHLPVQSGSDTMLKKMKRNYTREIYLRGLNALKAAIPDVAVSTDIIVGFPGETEDDFQQTLSLVREAQFDSAYCFKYSPRPGTASAEWPDDIPDDVKEARVNELLALTDSQGAAKAAALIGSTQEVLIEQEKADGVVRGKTRGAWRVRLKGTDLKIGQTVNARIIGTHSRELHAELI